MIVNCLFLTKSVEQWNLRGIIIEVEDQDKDKNLTHKDKDKDYRSSISALTSMFSHPCLSLQDRKLYSSSYNILVVLLSHSGTFEAYNWHHNTLEFYSETTYVYLSPSEIAQEMLTT